MKKYFFIALALLCHSARAQNDAQQTIYFNTGKTLNAEKIRLRTGGFNDYYLLADGKRIQVGEVKFFENDRGFFANTQQLNPLRISGFAERIDRGRVNLYKPLPRYYEVYDEHHDHWDAETSGSIDLYYNKGFDNLKKMNYANLMSDLNGSPQSLDFLAAYRKKRNTANVFIGIAGASFVASFITFFSGDKNPPLGFGQISSPKIPYTSFILLGVGAGFGAVGAINYVKSRNELTNAVDAYNR